MADRVYPSAKPNPQPPQAVNSSGGPPSFPATKAQAYGATRPPYRPRPMKSRSRSRRGCCCTCCLWLTFILIALVLLAAIAGGIFYVLYRPRRPEFTVSSLRLVALNVTTSNQLASRLDLSITARNPNKKLVYLYDPISIAVFSSGVDIGDGSFPAFIHDTQNTTVLKTTVSTSGESVDASTAADLKKSRNLPLEIDLETKAGVKIGGLKTKKIGIKVRCEGIDVSVPKKKTAVSPSSPDAMCKVKLRIKRGGVVVTGRRRRRRNWREVVVRRWPRGGVSGCRTGMERKGGRRDGGTTPVGDAAGDGRTGGGGGGRWWSGGGGAWLREVGAAVWGFGRTERKKETLFPS